MNVMVTTAPILEARIISPHSEVTVLIEDPRVLWVMTPTICDSRRLSIALKV